uniref:Uncharacterized protein n=1 Tax=Rhizophora mucronata TaxID=61149 RepID=A0A2P2NPM3_RHIMU
MYGIPLFLVLERVISSAYLPGQYIILPYQFSFLRYFHPGFLFLLPPLLLSFHVGD